MGLARFVGRTMLGGLLAAILVLAAASVAHAQRSRPPDGTWRFVADPFAGLHFFGPMRISGTAFVGYGNADHDTPAVDSRFVLAIAEPGWQGGRVSLAYVQWMGLTGGFIGRASLLRFWDGRPRDHAGVELQWIISVIPLGVRIGAFRRQSDDRKGILWLADMSVMY